MCRDTAIEENAFLFEATITTGIMQLLLLLERVFKELAPLCAWTVRFISRFLAQLCFNEDTDRVIEPPQAVSDP